MNKNTLCEVFKEIGSLVLQFCEDSRRKRWVDEGI
jgi:hypothetical protein